ncbi:MAG: ROK family protein [Planctomycetes bacterium]|nr:ROK family protein [Planctomycetota bacterium]
MKYYIGLDLGGTNIKGGLLDEKANVVAQHSIPTEAKQGPEHVFDRLAFMAGKLMADAKVEASQIKGIGVGTPGPVDRNGVVLSAPNLAGWKNVPLASELNKRMPMPIKIVNDADAAGYGEYWAGAGRDESIKYLILLTLGTGVGGGIVLDGKLYAGSYGAGAELGHTIIQLDGEPCGCGQRGCLEQYTSATAIARSAARAMAAGEKTSLPANPTTRQVFEALEAGDALAEKVVNRACEYLGIACVNFVRTFDPQMIVLGGGVAAAGEALSKRVRASFMKHTWRIVEPKVIITTATLGNDAGFIGAAGMTRSA